MHPFRHHDFGPSHAAPCMGFGRRSPRRYGHGPGASTPGPAECPDGDRAGAEEPACWVDQDFEEAVFE